MTSLSNPSKKLLVILGAGSSIPFGMPSVSCINENMLKWSAEWQLPKERNSHKNYFKLLWDISESYFNTHSFFSNVYPNYESVLGEMTSLINWLIPPPYGNPVIEKIGTSLPGSTIADLFEFSNEEERYNQRYSILEQQEFLIRKLANYMRNLCLRSHPDIGGYTEFLQRLRDHFDLGIYNLNYDNIALKAWPEAFYGFDDTTFSYSPSSKMEGYLFDPNAIFNRQEWGFIYHLHGSVNFNLKKPNNYTKGIIEWEKNLDGKFEDYESIGFDPDKDSMFMPFTTLLTGGFKLEQLLPEPYHTFYSALARHVYEADAFLIIGYSFGDFHVNRVIQNRIELPDHRTRNHPGLMGRKRPKVVILDKSCEKRTYTAKLQSRHFTPWQMTHVFDVRFRLNDFEDSRSIKEVSDADGFEKAENTLFLRHDGVEDAFLKVDKIIERLN